MKKCNKIYYKSRPRKLRKIAVSQGKFLKTVRRRYNNNNKIDKNNKNNQKLNYTKNLLSGKLRNNQN